MLRALSALVLAAGLALAPAPSPAPAPASPAGPPASGGPHGAAAWVLRVDGPSGTALGLADAAVSAGPAPSAGAAPVVAGGVAPVRAAADPARPDERAVATPLRWTDPSGSLTVEGGVAEAQASPASATARAGFSTAGGTGFPVANRLFTWEQQERILAEVAAIDAAVFNPLNARTAALAPVLAAAGITAPRFEPLAPVGLVDVGRGSLGAASAEVAGSGDYSSGRAEAVLDHVRLLGGFVEADGVSSEAVAERSVSGGGQRGGVWFKRLTVAGVPVVADGGRIRVAGNDTVSRDVVQPALDLLLAALRDNGVDLRAGAVVNGGDGARAAALELAVTAPAGRVAVSVAGAVAAAPAFAEGRAPAAPPSPSPTGQAWDSGPAAGVTAPPLPPPAQPAVATGLSPSATGGAEAAGEAAPASVAPAAQPSGRVGGPPAPRGTSERFTGGAGPTRRRLATGRLPQPAATARSVRATYLVLTLAASAGAVVLPALVLPAPVRPDRRRRR